MMVIIGWLVALACIFGAYVAIGGQLALLMSPAKFIMIFGGALGATIAASNPHGFKHVVGGVASCFKGSKYSKKFYMELLALLYDIMAKGRKEGLMALESDIDEPENSPVFSKYPLIQRNHRVMEFVTDYLRMMVGGNLNPMEIENLMDSEIETHLQEEMHTAHAVSKMADALPAFGIVAAVMGVVITMGSLHLPPEELGKLIGTALVGAFLGILLSYAFISPLGSVLESRAAESAKALQTVKVVLLASINGFAPQVCVEFGRKVLFANERPSFIELEEDIKARKG
ncbi:MAG: flagellar motor stator protein MotA [Thiohalomonadaceae bacterium]